MEHFQSSRLQQDLAHQQHIPSDHDLHTGRYPPIPAEGMTAHSANTAAMTSEENRGMTDPQVAMAVTSSLMTEASKP